MKQSKTDRSNSKPIKAIQRTSLSRRFLAVFAGSKQPATFDEKGAKKVDPKIFFANERTFLKWMNVSVWVAAISIGLSSIRGTPADAMEALSSLSFLAIAMVIVIYSMFQCKYQLFPYFERQSNSIRLQ